MTRPDAGIDRLPADAGPGRVRLRVRDLDRSIRFYCDVLGLEAREAGPRTTALGARDTEPALVLTEDPAIVPRPPGTAGLYHVALLLPDRPSLASAVARLLTAEQPVQGLADHDVSEAVYLVDPDGIGLELYADRPRESWEWTDGSIRMSTRSVHVPSLLASRGGADPLRMPAGTRVGHIHLQVTDLAAAESFYGETLGFDVVNREFPGALFLSAGGYHHHIGLNTWGNPGPAPAGIAGMIEFELRVPDTDARSRLENRLAPFVVDPHEAPVAAPPEAPPAAPRRAPGIPRFRDPDGNTLLLTP